MKEFECDAYALVTYTTVTGSRNKLDLSSIYTDCDDEIYWKSLDDVERDFDKMLEHCGKDLDAENRQDLFIYMYSVYKGWIN